jgi:hypothetical protein
LLLAPHLGAVDRGRLRGFRAQLQHRSCSGSTGGRQAWLVCSRSTTSWAADVRASSPWRRRFRPPGPVGLPRAAQHRWSRR